MSDSISEHSLTRLDHIVVDALRKLLCRPTLQGSTDSEQASEEKKRRIEGLERFVLALSDQQLVTGIAILIAGYISPCSMDSYHFQIVASLAWFSSTTHLSTLVLLRRYLIEHPIVRTWRVIGMLITLLGLLAAQFFIFDAEANLHNLTLPAYCGIGRLATPADSVPVLGLNLSGIVIYLLFSYGNNITALYSEDKNSNVGVIYLVLGKLESKFPGRKEQSHETRLQKRHVSELTPEDDLTESERQHHMNVTINTSGNRLSAVANSQLFVLSLVRKSFLGHVLWLVFGSVYGLIQIVRARWTVVSKLAVNGSENDMGFGQIVPLLLLALPLLAVGEVYYGSTLTKFV